MTINRHLTIDRRRLLGFGGAGLVVIGTGSAGLFAARADAQELTVEQVLFDPDLPALGNPEGDVTIVEFFDYQCPYCKKNHPTLMKVAESDGKLRIVMKDWPIFGAASVYASQLVLGAVELGQYAPAHEALMATPARLSNAQIDAALTGAGLDIGAAMNSYKAERARWDALLARNASQAALFGLAGTPAFIIGRTIYPGALDADMLRQAVAEARKA